MMKMSELRSHLTVLTQGRNETDDPEVVIKVVLPYATVGGMPTVTVKSVHLGFDWDKGKLILAPEESLTPRDRDFAEKMKEMQEKLGWAQYENRGLNAEIKRLKKQLKAEQ